MVERARPSRKSLPRRRRRARRSPRPRRTRRARRSHRVRRWIGPRSRRCLPRRTPPLHRRHVRLRVRLLPPPPVRRWTDPAAGCTVRTRHARRMTRTARTGTPRLSVEIRTTDASSVRGASPPGICRRPGVAPADLRRRLPSRWPSAPSLAASGRVSDPTVLARTCVAAARLGATVPMPRAMSVTGGRRNPVLNTVAVAGTSTPAAVRRSSEEPRMEAAAGDLQVVPSSIDRVRLRGVPSAMFGGIRAMFVTSGMITGVLMPGTNAMIAGPQSDAVRARRRPGRPAARLCQRKRGVEDRGTATERLSKDPGYAAIRVVIRARPGMPGCRRRDPESPYPLLLLLLPRGSSTAAGSWCAIRSVCMPTGR